MCHKAGLPEAPHQGCWPGLSGPITLGALWYCTAVPRLQQGLLPEACSCPHRTCTHPLSFCLQRQGRPLPVRASPGVRPALGGIHVLYERLELVQGQLAHHQAAAPAAALAAGGQGVLPCQHSLGHGAAGALEAAGAADGAHAHGCWQEGAACHHS